MCIQIFVTYISCKKSANFLTIFLFLLPINDVHIYILSKSLVILLHLLPHFFFIISIPTIIFSYQSIFLLLSHSFFHPLPHSIVFFLSNSYFLLLSFFPFLYFLISVPRKNCLTSLRLPILHRPYVPITDLSWHPHSTNRQRKGEEGEGEERE